LPSISTVGAYTPPGAGPGCGGGAVVVVVVVVVDVVVVDVVVVELVVDVVVVDFGGGPGTPPRFADAAVIGTAIASNATAAVPAKNRANRPAAMLA
jgi:hypothetical protein